MDIFERQTLIFFGVTFGAIIAGVFSLISLIISKENKTSEFRQQWIDSLRDEISNFLSNLTQYTYLSCLGDSPSEKKDGDDEFNKKLDKYDLEFSLKRKERVFDAKLEVVKYYSLIKLRINKNEVNKNLNEYNSIFINHLDVIYKEFIQKSLDKNEKHSIPPTNYTHQHFTTIELVNEYVKLINDSASPILKYEWERVKAGEKWYRIAKYVSAAIFIICMIGILIISLTKKTVPEKNPPCAISCPTKYIELMHKNQST
jgi:hypothetical protein